MRRVQKLIKALKKINRSIDFYQPNEFRIIDTNIVVQDDDVAAHPIMLLSGDEETVRITLKDYNIDTIDMSDGGKVLRIHGDSFMIIINELR